MKRLPGAGVSSLRRAAIAAMIASTVLWVKAESTRRKDRATRSEANI